MYAFYILLGTLPCFNQNVDTLNNVKIGRPRKHSITSNTIKKPRGRPRKSEQPSEQPNDATYPVDSNFHSCSTKGEIH